jgi:hypothetical protein
MDFVSCQLKKLMTTYFECTCRWGDADFITAHRNTSG